MNNRTTLWTLTNEFQQTITCILEEQDPRTFLLVVRLERDDVVSETYYTAAAAISRARSLRDSLACRNWVPTS
jgi:hypothetical protein